MAITITDTERQNISLEGASGPWARTVFVNALAGDVVILTAFVRIQGTDTQAITSTLTADGANIGTVQTRTSRDGTQALPTRFWSIAGGVWVKQATSVGPVGFTMSGTRSAIVPTSPLGRFSELRYYIASYNGADLPTGQSAVVGNDRGTVATWDPGDFDGPTQVFMFGVKQMVATRQDSYGFPDAPAQMEFSSAQMTRFLGTGGTHTVGTWNLNPFGFVGAGAWPWTNDAKVAFITRLKEERTGGLFVGQPLGSAGLITFR